MVATVWASSLQRTRKSLPYLICVSRPTTPMHALLESSSFASGVSAASSIAIQRESAMPHPLFFKRFQCEEDFLLRE